METRQYHNSRGAQDTKTAKRGVLPQVEQQSDYNAVNRRFSAVVVEQCFLL